MSVCRGKCVWIAGFLLLLNSPRARGLDALAEAEDRRQPYAPALREAAESADPEIRERAARAWGRIQKPESIDALLAMLGDKNRGVRSEALFALGQFGWDSSFAAGRETEIAHALADQLAADASTRRTIIEALGKIALLETPKLVEKSLRDADPSVRAAAILALYRYRLVAGLRNPSAVLPAPDGALVDTIAQLADDRAAEVQTAAAYYFSRVPDRRGQAAMQALAQSKNIWTKLYSLGALKKLDADDVSIERAVSALSDSRVAIRVAALQALAVLAVSRIPADLEFDLSRAVRAQYAQALVASTDANATPTLQRLLRDPSSSVRSAALIAIAQRLRTDPALIQLLNNALGERNWVLRRAAVTAAGSLPVERRLEFLSHAREDEDPRVISTVVDAYASIDDPAAFQFIAVALTSDALAVRGAAVAALSSRKEPAVLANAWSCYESSASEKWTETREQLANLIAAIPGDESTSYLRNILSDSAASVAGIAFKALQSRGFSDVAPPAAGKLSFSPYRELRFKRNPQLFIETEHGVLRIELFAKAAPIHVATIVGFVEAGGYDGLPIHRVVPNFVVQGGDPDKSGWGSAGYSLRAEINREPFERGTVGMPRSQGFDTGGVQFFIDQVNTPHLEGQYTVFGKVTAGINIVDELEVGDLIVKAWVKR